MAKLPKPGDRVHVKPSAHFPDKTTGATVISAAENSLYVTMDNGNRVVVLSDNWVPAALVEPQKPAPGPWELHNRARAADPTIRRTDANLRAVFGPTVPAKPAQKAKPTPENTKTKVLAQGVGPIGVPGDPGPGENCDHGQPVEALADLCRDTIAGHCDGGSVGIYGHQVTVDKDWAANELVVVATPNAGRQGRVHKYQVSMRNWIRYIGNTKSNSEDWARRVVDLVRDSGYQDLARQLSAASRRRRFR